MHTVHRRIARVAHERGLLPTDLLCEAMVQLGRLAEEEEAEPAGLSFWLESGWLDQAQIAEVLNELGVLDQSLSEADGVSAVAIDIRTDALRDVDFGDSAADTPSSSETSWDHFETQHAGTDDRESDRFDSVAETLMASPERAEDADAESAPEDASDGDLDASDTREREAPDVDPDHVTQVRTGPSSSPGILDEADADVGDVLRFSVSERYVPGRELGSGGGGRVVRAFDRVLGRTVAMKVLRAEAHTDPKDTARFMAEAQATGQLEHPNIVPIYDFGVLPSGELYYTMREVRRHSLRDALNGIKRGDPKYLDEYTLVRLMTILRQVCQAAHYAHVRGVVHRDVKPDNIMLGDYGEVLVMDWGLARILDRGLRTNLGLSEADESGHTLGTPAYMPPEQARGELDLVDEQSDIYSLGAVLYEVLTLEPPFTGEDPTQTMWQVVEGELVPPGKRAPNDRAVPQELERICLKAMARHKEQRYTSAKQFHEELEDWIEGIQPREARRKVEAGRRARRMYEELSERMEDLDEAVRRLASQVEGWEPIDRKRELWELEDDRERARAESARAFGEAVSNFTQALAYQPDNEDARKGLAAMYWNRLQDAKSSHNFADAIYFEALVRQYDDDDYIRILDSQCGLRLQTEPAGATVTLSRYEESDRRLVPVEERELGVSPLDVGHLEEGSYRMVVDADELPPVQMPVRLERGKSTEMQLDVPDADAWQEGFVYVPAGEFIAGGDPDAFDPRPQRRVEIDGFFCSVFPVTFQAYLEWINELYEDDPDQAIERAPQTRGAEGLLVRYDEDREMWVPDEILIEGPAREQYPAGEGHENEIPVVGIRHDDAIAYCEWRGARDGRGYRLPTELELEKAGRGVDGRFFPWGNRFDPTFCKMRFSRPDLPQLEPVGVFEDDCSPYGVRDLAGGVKEWCRGDDTEGVVDQPIKGGAWNQDTRGSRLASRVQVLAAARTAGIGMRMVYT